MTTSNVTRLYVVKPGDTLSSISKKAYGDASMSSTIANANSLTNDAILPIGTRLAIPTITPSLGDDTQMIETMDVTAANQGKVYNGPGPTYMSPVSDSSPWYTDWKTYAIGALLIGGLWLMFKRK